MIAVALSLTLSVRRREVHCRSCVRVNIALGNFHRNISFDFGKVYLIRQNKKIILIIQQNILSQSVSLFLPIRTRRFRPFQSSIMKHERNDFSTLIFIEPFLSNCKPLFRPLFRLTYSGASDTTPRQPKEKGYFLHANIT